MQSLTERALRIGILGGKGLLGSSLVDELGGKHKAVSIDREDYESAKGASFDVLINANGNSKRFWANEHPLEDFEASTASVYRSLFDFKFQKYIYISSSDVYHDHASPETTKETEIIRPELLSPYGFHKYVSEQIVRRTAPHYLILRSAMMLGPALKKGPFFDIAQGSPLFINSSSRLQLIGVREIATVIQTLLDMGITQDVYNVGGRGAFSFATIQSYASRSVAFSPDASLQEYEMNVEKLCNLYPLKTSEEYFRMFLKEFPL